MHPNSACWPKKKTKQKEPPPPKKKEHSDLTAIHAIVLWCGHL